MIRVGLIGLGMHGKRYARHLLDGEVPGLFLTSVSRRDELLGKTFASENGLAYYARPRELCWSPHVDAIIVASPAAHHDNHAFAAFQGGKFVLVEKPFSRTTDLNGDYEGTENKLMVAHTFRYEPAIKMLRQHLRDLGIITHVNIVSRLQPETRFHDGALLDHGVHGFDLIRWLLQDEIESVRCVTRMVRSSQHEDFFHASLLTRTGTHASVEVSQFLPMREARVEVVGTEGTLTAYPHENMITGVGMSKSCDPADTIPAVLLDFYLGILNGPMPITWRDGLAAVKVAKACSAAADSSSVIVCPSQ
jgi:predicted dehydrogenase